MTCLPVRAEMAFLCCTPFLPSPSNVLYGLHSQPLSLVSSRGVVFFPFPPVLSKKLHPIRSLAEISTSKIKSEEASLSLSDSFRISRRVGIVGSVATSLFLSTEGGTGNEAKAAAAISVGSYLPKTEDGQFVMFTPGEASTPALRAGNVSPYSFILPPTWTQARIANILSGNYCQPKCAEPWIEVKFENPKQGTLLVVASPMVRLTNKPNSRIEDIGQPEKIISALGSFVTGDSYDPDEVVETTVVKVGDQTYYNYVLETPFARSGTHNLASATAKGNTVLLLVVSASDAQWAANEKTLRKLATSFSV